MKDAYYFPHDSNATGDPQIMEMMDTMGTKGYGAYWILIEHLREQQDYVSNLKVLRSLAKRNMSVNDNLQEVEQIFTSIVHDYGLFYVDEEGRFYSNSLIRRMKAYDERKTKLAEAGRKGGLSKGKATPKQRSTSKGEENRKEDNSVPDGIIDYLNTRTGKQFRHTASNRKLIKGRLGEGFTEKDAKAVIDVKVKEWLHDKDMNKYLNPETLFRPSKFEKYLNQKSVPAKEVSIGKETIGKCPVCGGELHPEGWCTQCDYEMVKED